jgi:hypothetical protein
MNPGRPFVLLRFPDRGQTGVSTRSTTRPTSGRITDSACRPVAKRERTVRFFQDIHGLVQTGRHHAAQFVACASGRGFSASQIVR